MLKAPVLMELTERVSRVLQLLGGEINGCHADDQVQEHDISSPG
jgi:hypothetical protein